MRLTDDMPASDAERFVKFLGLTTSAHDGEALAAIRKANDILRRNKLTWAEVCAGRGHKVPLPDPTGSVCVHVGILRASQRAVQVRCADNIPRWIPRSQIMEPGWETVAYAPAGSIMALTIPAWLAAQDGIPVAREAPATRSAAGG